MRLCDLTEYYFSLAISVKLRTKLCLNVLENLVLTIKASFKFHLIFLGRAWPEHSASFQAELFTVHFSNLQGKMDQEEKGRVSASSLVSYNSSCSFINSLCNILCEL